MVKTVEFMNLHDGLVELVFTKGDVVEDLKWQLSFAPDEFDITYFQETFDLLKTLMEKENDQTN